MVIGIKSALVAQKDIMILIYLIIGAVIGQLINIDKRIKDFSQYLEDKFVKEKNSLSNEKSFAKGFSTATILYCVGAMVILGSINSGLTNDNTILNIKAILDGVISIVLTSIYGIGVIFSAFLVFLYQGIFYLFASQIKDYLNPQAISELNAVGGILVLAIGINMTFKKDIKTANMLPAIFIPLLVFNNYPSSIYRATSFAKYVITAFAPALLKAYICSMTILFSSIQPLIVAAFIMEYSPETL